MTVETSSQDFNLREPRSPGSATWTPAFASLQLLALSSAADVATMTGAHSTWGSKDQLAKTTMAVAAPVVAIYDYRFWDLGLGLGLGFVEFGALILDNLGYIL